MSGENSLFFIDRDPQNTSGCGDRSVVPNEVEKWNWGAFLLTWIWGIGNRCYIALFALIPIVSIFMRFYLGFHGNELAWRNNIWENPEELHRSQRKWTKIALAAVAAVIVIFAIRVAYETNAQKRDYELGRNQIEASEDLRSSIGNDYEILSGPTVVKVGTTNGEFVVGATFIVRVNDEIYFIDCKLDDNENISDITINKGK